MSKLTYPLVAVLAAALVFLPSPVANLLGYTAALVFDRVVAAITAQADHLSPLMANIVNYAYYFGIATLVCYPWLIKGKQTTKLPVWMRLLGYHLRVLAPVIRFIGRFIRTLAAGLRWTLMSLLGLLPSRLRPWCVPLLALPPEGIFMTTMATRDWPRPRRLALIGLANGTSCLFWRYVVGVTLGRITTFQHIVVLGVEIGLIGLIVWMTYQHSQAIADLFQATRRRLRASFHRPVLTQT